MAFDGLMTRAVTTELRDKILQGKIEKIYQPETDVLVFTIHTRQGNVKLLMSAGSSHARMHLVKEAPVNPPEPYPFCMLMRKHLNAARITDVSQVGCERIIEITFETMNELGFTVNNPKGAFYLMVKAPDGDSKKVSQTAKELGLLIVPADTFGATGWLRLATCVSPQTAKDSLALFEQLSKIYGLI
jgi:hypothetical protein